MFKYLPPELFISFPQSLYLPILVLNFILHWTDVIFDKYYKLLQVFLLTRPLFWFTFVFGFHLAGIIFYLFQVLYLFLVVCYCGL